ncbi:MAG: hypothetical protein EBY36_05135 [Gammaproteobacteria bacterium]|nr:hypothetical protein [Gammaproteobacteria bacterium]
MSLVAADKAQVVSDYATAPGDTGSPEVQVALLTARITDLTDHFSLDWPSRSETITLFHSFKRSQRIE